MVSTGKAHNQKASPATAPEAMTTDREGGGWSWWGGEEDVDMDVDSCCCTNAIETKKHPQPTESLKTVLAIPFQRPAMPSDRSVCRMTDIGPRGRMADDDVVVVVPEACCLASLIN
mmetsp:Transcript_90206/g.135242  ORF Transcript_90206/g.135242 Transcript_90206/m.135242 type:complete len:116 (-) Transcript_90206:935-1282(-)